MNFAKMLNFPVLFHFLGCFIVHCESFISKEILKSRSIRMMQVFLILYFAWIESVVSYLISILFPYTDRLQFHKVVVIYYNFFFVLVPVRFCIHLFKICFFFLNFLFLLLYVFFCLILFIYFLIVALIYFLCFFLPQIFFMGFLCC